MIHIFHDIEADAYYSVQNIDGKGTSISAATAKQLQEFGVKQIEIPTTVRFNQLVVT